MFPSRSEVLNGQFDCVVGARVQITARCSGAMVSTVTLQRKGSRFEPAGGLGAFLCAGFPHACMGFLPQPENHADDHAIVQNVPCLTQSAHHDPT